MKILFVFFLMLFSLYAKNIPPIAFLGYTNDEWKVCILKQGKFAEIKLAKEAHTFDYDFKNAQIVYSTSNGKIYLHKDTKERELQLSYEKNSFTQPSFLCKKKGIYVVKLLDKNSKSTQIDFVDLHNDSLKPVVRQNSSQFEPLDIDTKNILYTNLICNQGCGKLIQEIWEKNLVTGISKQITLLNVFSSNPSIHYGSYIIFFNANKYDNYNIWAKNIITDAPAFQVSFSNFIDTNPVAIDEESFLFLQQRAHQSFIVYGNLEGEFYTIELPARYYKIRQLKVQRCD